MFNTARNNQPTPPQLLPPPPAPSLPPPAPAGTAPVAHIATVVAAVVAATGARTAVTASPWNAPGIQVGEMKESGRLIVGPFTIRDSFVNFVVAVVVAVVVAAFGFSFATLQS